MVQFGSGLSFLNRLDFGLAWLKLKQTVLGHTGSSETEPLVISICVCVCMRERERERTLMDVAQLVGFPNRDDDVMGSTSIFHSGIK